MKIQRWITYPLLNIIEFVVELAVKAIIYKNSGNKMPTGYNTHKLFSKVADYYTDYFKSSPKWGIRAIFEARRNLLSELDKLSTSSYIVKVPSPAPVLSAAVEQVTKKVKKASTNEMEVANNSKADKDAAIKALEESFVKNYPSLKTFKGLFFKLDGKADTLRFIQLVLIKIIRYTFWPLLLTTIYIYILKIISFLVLFMGTGYGYLRYSGIDIQSSDITRLATILRDYTINFWTRFINKAFGVELVNKDELFKEAYQQARIDVYNEVKDEALNRAEELARSNIEVIRESYAKQLQSVYEWASRVNTRESFESFKKGLSDYINILTNKYKNSSNTSHEISTNKGEGTEIVLDPYINKVNSIIIDIGSYILSAIAVGTLIGIYLYWKSSNPGSGGVGGTNGSAFRPTGFGVNQTDTHNASRGLYNRLTRSFSDGSTRRGQAVIERANHDAVHPVDTGDTISIVRPVLKGIKFTFILIGNGILALTTWISTEDVPAIADTGADTDSETESNNNTPNGRSSDNQESKGKGGSNVSDDSTKKSQQESSIPNPTISEASPITEGPDKGIEITGSDTVTQSNVLNESTNRGGLSTKTFKQIEADLIEQTIEFTDFL